MKRIEEKIIEKANSVLSDNTVDAAAKTYARLTKEFIVSIISHIRHDHAVTTGSALDSDEYAKLSVELLEGIALFMSDVVAASIVTVTSLNVDDYEETMTLLSKYFKKKFSDSLDTCLTYAVERRDAEAKKRGIV
jgi:hypothetical protein